MGGFSTKFQGNRQETARKKCDLVPAISKKKCGKFDRNCRFKNAEHSKNGKGRQ